MGECGDGFGLRCKSRQRRGVLRQMLRQNFDRDFALETGIPGPKDFHPSRPQRSPDLYGPR